MSENGRRERDKAVTEAILQNLLFLDLDLTIPNLPLGLRGVFLSKLLREQLFGNYGDQTYLEIYLRP
jgi:hypothetical protein